MFNFTLLTELFGNLHPCWEMILYFDKMYFPVTINTLSSESTEEGDERDESDNLTWAVIAFCPLNNLRIKMYIQIGIQLLKISNYHILIFYILMSNFGHSQL